MIYKDIRIPIPAYVMYVIKSLRIIGKDPYVVGGGIRDYFLGDEPNDFDLVINESPYKLYQFFNTNDNIDVTTMGIMHGTIKLWIGDHDPIDLTEYGNNPNYVDISVNKLYNPTIYDDVSRRDFTMNALAYSPYNGLIDMYDGISDINNHILRFIRDPEEQIENDPFLILRAIRQAMCLDFTMDYFADEVVWDYQYVKLLNKVSGWRRGNELKKILSIDYTNASILQKSYLKNFLKYVCYYVLEPNNIVCGMDLYDKYKYMFSSDKWELKIAYLLSDYSNENAEDILKEFEYDSSDILNIMKYRNIIVKGD